MNAVFSKADGQCHWFAMCANPAVAELPHPILHLVRICDRCLHLTMRRTEFEDYEGVFNMPVILYKLIADHNKGLDDMYHFEEPYHADEAWSIPMGELLCIEGCWTLTVGLTHAGLFPEAAQFPKNGVYYQGDLMIIRGDDGSLPVFWLFKKA